MFFSYSYLYFSHLSVAFGTGVMLGRDFVGSVEILEDLHVCRVIP
jgi:hypothetical protein